MNEENIDLATKIEALLFAYGEKVSIERLVKVLGSPKREIMQAIDILGERLTSGQGALTLARTEEEVQLVTKSSLVAVVSHFVKEEIDQDLTSAAAETLAIITYTGPVSRSSIDYIRGVNSSFILRSLLIRGLIDREVDPQNARSYRYAPSLSFLKHLGLEKKEALSDYATFKEAIKSLEAHPINETPVTNE